MGKISYVPFGTSLIKTLTKHLLFLSRQDPLFLGKHLILLPTRRGCLALTEALKKNNSGKSLILPKIMALSDIEEGAWVPGYLPRSQFPPVINSWDRLGVIVTLIRTFEKNQGHRPAPLATVTKLATDLLSFLDEAETSDISLQMLHTLVPDDYATHWQATLTFLKILTDYWPAILAEKGKVDSAHQRRLILTDLATHWNPFYPVILAGTTGTRPATASLLKAIFHQPEGHVILPCFDPHACYEDLPPTHPLYTLKTLLSFLGNPSISPLGNENPERSDFLSKLMAPSIPSQWHLSLETRQKLKNIHMVPCTTLSQEAQVIALIMRYHLETPDQRITLVTPSQRLTRAVMAELQRWGLYANTSTGIPLSQTLVGSFFIRTAHLITPLSTPDFLSILKHPLCQKSHNRFQHLQKTRHLEASVFRKKRIVFSPETILNYLENNQDWLANILQICHPLLSITEPLSLPEIIQRHISVCLHLTGNASPQSPLWEHEDGNNCRDFLENLCYQGLAFPAVSPRDYPTFLSTLLSQESIRQVEGIGSRLSILGTLEARLLTEDVVIMGGLNEGTWPSGEDTNLWLSRSMRKTLGLPDPDRKIGLSAHDFCNGFSAKTVYLTRSLKQEGTTTIPSRWWQRLEALLSASDFSLSPNFPWQEWAEQLDAPSQTISLSAPCPKPPVNARPRELSVTAIERLMRDPYSIYAKHILQLTPLPSLDQEFTSADLGQVIHSVMDQFIKLGFYKQPNQFFENLISIGQKEFQKLASDPRTHTFWWPRFERICQWIDQQLTQDLSCTKEILSELSGKITIATPNGEILLKATADRLDILTTNTIHLIDYKTGSIPSAKDIALGYSPQLTLEGLIAIQGGFGSAIPQTLDKLAYWELKGNREAGKITVLKNIPDLLDEAAIGIEKILTCFMTAETPYLACPNPAVAPEERYHEYAHLERLQEWQ